MHLLSIMQKIGTCQPFLGNHLSTGQNSREQHLFRLGFACPACCFALLPPFSEPNRYHTVPNLTGITALYSDSSASKHLRTFPVSTLSFHTLIQQAAFTYEIPSIECSTLASHTESNLARGESGSRIKPLPTN